MSRPPSDVCRSCQAPIDWALTAAKKRRVPLDLGGCSAREPGALLIVVDVAGQSWAYSLRMLAERLAVSEQVSLTAAEDLAVLRYPGRRSHFASCPAADRHRKGRS